ncbi:MAG: cytochrome c-type biogenesis protein [Pseudomonadota bacterium]
MRRLLCCLLAAYFMGAPLSFAQGGPVDPPDLEERARIVGKQLRCVVCQNESIEESDAELAADMRLVVRERLRAGDTEAEVIARMRDRYGDYVLLKPPVQANTIILWLAPGLLVLGSAIWWIAASRRRQAVASPTRLTEAEMARLERFEEGR